MRASFGFALALGVLFAGCGGATRVGTSGDHGGSRESGGTSIDAAGLGGSGGAVFGGNPFTGGRRATGGRGPGGSAGPGGGPTSGGPPVGGAGGFEVDASLGGSDGGLGAGGRFFDAGDDPLRNRVPAGQVCDRFTTIQCAAERYCCPRTDRSFDACKQGMQPSCHQFFDVWTLEPEVAYDIDRAQVAFDEFEKRASVCDLTIVPWAISNAGFRAVARGTVEPGGTCVPLDAGPVTLQLIGRLAWCSMPESFACMAQPTNIAICAPRGAAGDPCFTDANCLDDYFCDPGQRACAPRGPDGSPCSSLLFCQSMNCDPNKNLCVPATLESVYCLAY
jgi:hypothetical protein